MSEQAKKLLIPVLNQDDENPPPVQQTETELSVSKGEDNEEGSNVQQDQSQQPKTMSGRTAALIEERGGI